MGKPTILTQKTIGNKMIDRKQVYLWWSLFHEDGDIAEVRVLGKRNYSGYYKNIEKLINDIEYYDNEADEQIYFILNVINPACYGRPQSERMVLSPKNSTVDDDIVGRRWVMVDLDPKRPSGTNSSKEELEKAHMKAIDVYRFLKDNGFSEPVIAMSGNGYHVNIPCRIGISEENDLTIKRFGLALSMLFDDEYVEVDKKVHNRSRLCKLYGSTSKKGANNPDRPWRRSGIIKYPQEIVPTDLAFFKKVADLYPEENPKPSYDNNWGREKFDLVAFLNKHGINYKAQSITGGTKYILDHCVFNENHKGKDAVIFQRDNGALSYFCFHSSCAHNGWKEFRLKFEPDAYDKKDYQEFQYKQRYYGNFQMQPFIPIKENEEKGKKWLSLANVQLKTSDDYTAIPTGYYMLDKVLMGMLLGEVTLLSGNNSSGKSSWMNCVMLNAIERGFKVAVWSGELPPTKMKEWIYQAAAGLPYTTKNHNYENVYDVDEKAAKRIDKWIDGKLFLFNNDYGNRWLQILSDMEEIIDKENTQLIVCDNLMALNIDDKQGDKNDKQKQFILDVVNLAKKKNVHIVIVAHPNKAAYATLLRKESISGTSDLTNAVQRVMIIHRVNEDFKKRAAEFFGKEKAQRYFDYSNVIEVCKDRSFGVQDFLFGMFYEIQTKRFKNTPGETIHYAWEQEPTQQIIHYSEPTIESDMPFEPSYNEEVPF